MSQGLKSWWEKWSKKNQVYPELKQKLNLLISLEEITQTIYQSLDSKVSFAALASKLRELLAFDYLITFGWDSQNQILELENWFPEKLSFSLKKRDQFQLNSELVKGVIQNQKSLSKFNTPSTESYCGFEKLTAQMKIASAMIFPLINDSQTTGLLFVGRLKDQSYTENELELVKAITPHLALARKNFRLYEELNLTSTQRKNTEPQPNQTDTLRMMKEVTSQTVHDFNNLLATILGRTEILQMKINSGNFPEKENLLKGLGVIEKTVEQGSQLLTQLSQLYKPKPEFRELDLKELLEEAVKLTKSQSPDKLSTKTIEVKLDEKISEIDKILGDEAELKKAFTDLISLALNSIPSSGKLRTQISENDKQVLVQFKTKEKLSGIISAGKITQELTNSKAIISQHKGELILDEKGEAESFISIFFPRAHPVPKKIEARASMMAHPNSGQILLFEEQQSLGDILQEYLQFLGYQVKKFKNPKLALEVFSSDKFDLVFTDVGRAGMFGWNFIEQIKKVKPEVPVIVIAAKGISFNTSELERQGIGGVIYKPFDFASIKQTVNSILDKSLASVKI
ncbi:MAG: hypothetical protein A2145_04035 [candidate division Zixibacteria bacterium RBG_16_40_9]|nr:MAG: hypothetical protein A2145_04035 [candidate division Zixibacteria bacterium RBG_16_40_9]